MDLVTPAVQGPLTFQGLVKGVQALPDGDVKKALVALVANAKDDLDTARKNIEAWFEDAIDRVSGCYKRTSHTWTVVIAAGITVLSNADTLNIAFRLWTDPAPRAAVVEQARQRGRMPRPAATVE